MNEKAGSEGALIPFAQDIWVRDAPNQFLGLQLGTRMTVVRLPDRSLLIHSPVGLTPALRSEIEALGEVRHIVASNAYHHLYAGEHQKAWPSALLHAPRLLRAKRRDLRVDHELGARPHEDWGGALEPLPIEGCDLHETVLFHGASKTLISSDLTENVQKMDHLPTRLYLQANGAYQRPAWPYVLRLVYRDRKKARRCIDAILERDFERVVIAHGVPIEREAREAVRSTFSWL